MNFAERMSRIKESPTLAVAARARALAAKGISVINFGPGEPDFGTPEHIKAACIEALKAGQTKYGAVAGMAELRRAISEKLTRDNHAQYSPDEIIITCGGKQAIFTALHVLIEDSDEVIIPSPYWVSYSDEVLLCDGTPVIVDTVEGNGFKLTTALLEKSLTKKSKMLIINSPCNPTGSVYSKDELAALGAVCARHGLWVLSDEIYEYLTYPPAKFASFAEAAPDLKERTVIVNGLSKAYSMTGWRLGFAAGPRPLIAEMAKWQGQVVTHPTLFAQAGAVAAYNGPQDAVVQMRAAFMERRDYVVETLQEIPGVSCVPPDGAFYTFVNVRAHIGKKHGGVAITDSIALADYLLDHAHIAVVAGEAFGTPGFLRFSYALSMEDIKEGLKRFAGALGQLAPPL